MQEKPYYIGHNMRFVRKYFGFTQKDFGAVFGISRATINTYESGTSPSHKVITQFCQEFNLDINAFSTMQAQSIEDLMLVLNQATLNNDFEQAMAKFKAASPEQKEALYSQMLKKHLATQQVVQYLHTVNKPT